MPRLYFRLLAAAAAPAGDHVPDAELLRRFVSAKDSAAFELVVRRHADAVWAAGYRVLRNEADADDAFQAAFLALARKAGSIRGRCVGGWLHRVAVNAAMKLRASRDRQGAGGLEANALPGGRGSSGDDPEQSEVAAVVHQELARLPDRYRLPVVLCDLEGQTHAEAAKALGWPVGSVSGRLSRAHGILRDRLTRRGLAAPAALLAAASAPTTAVTAATAVATGAVVSPVVASLAEGVLSAMRIAKLKLTAAVLAAAGLVALAGVGAVYALNQPPAPGPGVPAAGGQPPLPVVRNVPGAEKEVISTAFPDLKPPALGARGKDADALVEMCPRILGKDSLTADPGDDTYRLLLKEQIQEARRELIRLSTVIRIGRWTSPDFQLYTRCLTDLRQAAIELWGNDPKVLVPYLEELVILGKWFEAFIDQRVETGTDPPQLINAARRHRLQAEAALWKAKNRA